MPETEKKPYDDREFSFPPFVLRGTLPNGLNYFIMEHKKPDDRILAWLVVPVGSIHEQDGEYGIAHFIEHMAFKRTEHFPPGEVVKYFHSIGVDIGPGINALTDIDRTIYKIEVPSDREEYLIKALTLLCDFASSVMFLPEETEKEKDVILEELRLDSDVMTRLYNAHRDIRFKGSPYAQRYTLGTEETIKNTGAEDLKRFYSY
ncbi:MAG: insulinase family protein [Candidatus Eremiobacterota bacterium]